jgi:hypothetical protein
MPGIFISHTHGDQPLADALAALIEGLFGQDVKANYSSRKELNGGIAPGEDWFRWIVDQVREAEVALILLTPASIQKPWVLWEAGAVAGAAFATSNEQSRVFPMTFGVRGADVPTPFARTQLLSGTDEADIGKLLDELYGRLGKKFTPQESKRFGARQGDAVKTYLNRINPILLKLPLSITEAAVQEWLGRLTELERSSRFSEAQVMEDWMNVAFGRGTEDKERPFDVRIHRRLGELYSASGQAGDAARQLRLACKLAPRDIFLLRRLGKSYLDQKDPTQANAVLEEIKTLDANAYERNSENAALKARYYEETNNLTGARDVLAAAFANIPNSYYLGDKLGQVLLKLDERARAKEVYGQVARVLGELREQNVWTCATALAAAIVAGDNADVQKALSNLRNARPSRGELESVERGVGKLAAAFGREAILAELRAIETRQ